MEYYPKKDPKGINAFSLKLLALTFMLMDHLWASIIPANQWLTYVGRLAFPIFAFQIVQGYHHTSDYKRYRNRLILFALISEIPYDLFKNGVIFYPFDQNVMFTLLLGLMCIHALETLKEQWGFKKYFFSALVMMLSTLLGSIAFLDYGGFGILMILNFYLFEDQKLMQLISMVLINVVFFKGHYIPFNLFGIDFEFQTQGFAIFALPLIWLYHGEKGDPSKFNRNLAYWFYPVHMLILYLWMYWRS